MATVELERDQLAEAYAGRHWRTDQSIEAIYYLPCDAPDQEIRLLEVNREASHLEGLPLEAIDFGIDVNSESFFKLLVLDVSPRQWQLISENKMQLPPGWTLKNAIACLKQNHE